MAGKITYDRFAFIVALKELLDKLNADVILRSQAMGQEASGQTYAESYTSVIETKEAIGGVSVWPGYLNVLQEGRKPGSVPWTFEDIILKWMQDKGITGQDISDEELARRIVWSIRLHGSRLHRDKIYLDVYDTLVDGFVHNVTKKVSDFVGLQIGFMMGDAYGK